DIQAAVADLKAKGVEFTNEIADQGYGLVTQFNMPGGVVADLYQPSYTKQTAPRPVAPLPPVQQAPVTRMKPARKKPQRKARTAQKKKVVSKKAAAKKGITKKAAQAGRRGRKTKKKK